MAGEVGGQAVFVFAIEAMGEGAFAEVDVHDEDFFVGEADACSQIAGDECFAGVGHE